MSEEHEQLASLMDEIDGLEKEIEELKRERKNNVKTLRGEYKLLKKMELLAIKHYMASEMIKRLPW